MKIMNLVCSKINHFTKASKQSKLLLSKGIDRIEEVDLDIVNIAKTLRKVELLEKILLNQQ